MGFSRFRIDKTFIDLPMAEKINIEGNEIAIKSVNEQDYISLTDIAKYRDPSRTADLIRGWLNNASTIRFLYAWEEMENPIFKLAEFGQFKNEALEGLLQVRVQDYIKRTGAIGIVSKSGRYGGTFAHKDIAFEFASYIEPVFKLGIIREFQRLKSVEYQQHKLEWSETRFLSKINAGILSESIKENLVPKDQKKGHPYATAFDMINLAVFDMTAKEWRAKNPDASGNIRDHASTIELILISNLESLNAVYIDAGASYDARLIRLYEVAKKQRIILEEDKRLNDDKRFLE